MKKTYIYSLLTILLYWFIISLLINNEIIFPSILDVSKSLAQIIASEVFVYAIINTLFRTFCGVFISFLFALVFGILSFRYSKFKDFLYPIFISLKTIPNISIIIIGLIWLGRNGSVLLIVSLVAFPLLYSNIMFGFENIDNNLMMITDTFQGEFIMKLKLVYLPLIMPNIINSIRNTLTLCFKVTIMAELLSQVSLGIGREMYFARINLNTSDIFAWTIIIILISTIFDKIIDYLTMYLKSH